MGRRRSRAEDAIRQLPEDIWIDILLRIPGSKVFKLVLLSKYFKGLIDSEEFIRRHYDESIKTRPSLILYHTIERKCTPICRKIRTIEKAAIHLDFEFGCKVDELIKPPLMMDSLGCFLGCHRSILCYVDHLQNLIFWNPLTGVYRKNTSSKFGKYCDRYLFGYDAVTDDFKVLRITASGIKANSCVIYTSKTDSWRSTQGKNQDFCGTLYAFYQHEIFVEGTNCIHMIFSDSNGKNILAFDFSSENFNLVPLPENCTNWTNWDKKAAATGGLSSVEGCLCLYRCTNIDHILNAWTMKEYGVAESWVPLMSIELSSDSNSAWKMWPYGFAVCNRRPQLLLKHKIWQEKLYLYVMMMMMI